MEISKDTKKYIQLVEMQQDIEHGIRAAFEQAKENPILRDERKNRFWLISNPTTNSEFIDTITLVDAVSFGNIALGSSDGAMHHSEQNYELYPEVDETSAKRDAYNRWMKFK